ALREHARRLGINVSDLVAALGEWRAFAAERGNDYEKALAALYSEKYTDAIELLSLDIAATEQQVAQEEGLRASLPGKYLNLGIAHAGNYEFLEAIAAYKKALDLDSRMIQARLLLSDAYDFLGRN